MIAQNSREAAVGLALAHHTRDVDGFLEWHRETFPALWDEPLEPWPATDPLSCGGNRRAAECQTVIAMAMAGTHFPDAMEAYLDYCKNANPTLWYPGEVTALVSGRGQAVFGVPIYSTAKVWKATGPNGDDIPFYANPIGKKWTQLIGEFPQTGSYVIRTAEDVPVLGPPAPMAPEGVFVQGEEVLVWDMGTPNQKHGMTETLWVAHVGNIRIFAWTWDFRMSTQRWMFLAVRNGNVTGLNSQKSQPTCLDYGSIEDIAVSVRLAHDEDWSVRWGAEMGAVSGPDGYVLCSGHVLRAGEQVGWWLTPASESEPTVILEDYGQAFGPTANVEWPEMDDLQKVLVDGFSDRQYHLINDPQGQLQMVRESGDFLRDFEGPAEALTKTHNAEYDWPMGLFRVMARQAIWLTPADWQIVEDSHDLALMACWHAANVDLYHHASGPLPWMHGGPFPHINHGSSGTHRPHRGTGPNAGHWTGRFIRYGQMVSGDNPLLRDAADLRNGITAIKARGGPGMPYLSNSTGEHRAPAYLINTLVDEWVLYGSVFARDMAVKVIEESADSPLLRQEWGDNRYKPWMVCLLLESLLYARESGISAAWLPAMQWQDLILETGMDPSGDHLLYERGWGSNAHRTRGDDMPGAFWNLLAADVLFERDPSLAVHLAEGAMEAGGWYPGHNPEQWASVLVGGGMIQYGHRYAILEDAQQGPPSD